VKKPKKVKKERSTSDKKQRSKSRGKGANGPKQTLKVKTAKQYREEDGSAMKKKSVGRSSSSSSAKHTSARSRQPVVKRVVMREISVQTFETYNEVVNDA
jgi:hypothetical protein